MDISEVARRSGLPASTLRYYEGEGLIASSGRRGLRRTFSAEVLRRLALISLGRTVGFSLEEIGRMLLPHGKPRIDRRALAEKADELDILIRELTAKRDGLRHAATCPAKNHMECPKFLRILKMTESGMIAVKPKRSAHQAARKKLTPQVRPRGDSG